MKKIKKQKIQKMIKNKNFIFKIIFIILIIELFYL